MADTAKDKNLRRVTEEGRTGSYAALPCLAMSERRIALDLAAEVVDGQIAGAAVDLSLTYPESVETDAVLV